MNNNFSDNLKKIRKDNNLSQEQLAEELGVSRQAISKWESGSSYPEMDKIIQMCNKFNLNIDDLLNKDITEIKGEEKVKNNINKYVDDFLNFITDTINLFSNMSFKSKIKCLFEQCVIGFILIILLTLGFGFYQIILANTLEAILPYTIFRILISILNSIYFFFAVIFSLIVLTHIFKTRYLDYYLKIKNNISEEDCGSTQKEDNNKILFKKNENKIIIRDPKNSEYIFINDLFKFIIGIIKIFALFFNLFLCFILVVLFVGVIFTFSIVKTGIFFLGIAISLLALATLNIIVILFLFNFIFNRQSNKKRMIWSFIMALVILGSGIGLSLLGSLKFEIVKDYDSDLYSTKIEHLPMKDDLFFRAYNLDILYIESDNEDIMLEYTIRNNCSLSISSFNDYDTLLTSYCSNKLETFKIIIDKINDYEIIDFTDNISDIKIYTTKENIEKIKINENKYWS